MQNKNNFLSLSLFLSHSSTYLYCSLPCLSISFCVYLSIQVFYEAAPSFGLFPDHFLPSWLTRVIRYKVEGRKTRNDDTTTTITTTTTTVTTTTATTNNITTTTTTTNTTTTENNIILPK